MQTGYSPLPILLAAALALAMPLIVALDQTRKLAFDATRDHALRYANEVLNRSDSAAAQIYAGVTQLTGTASSSPCSDDHLAAMRNVATVFSHLKAIGMVVGDRMVCSSWGAHADGLDLGPVEFRTSTGSSLRTGVVFAFAPGEAFTVVERAGYAAVIHKSLPIDTVTDVPDIVLGTFTPGSPTFRSARGSARLEWIDALGSGNETTFRDDTHVVAVLRSPRYQTGAIAAIPLTRYQQYVDAYMWRIMPIGLAAGIALMLALLYASRMQQSWPAMLRAALRRNELSVVYQPVVDLASRRLIGAEALVRWRRGNGESIRPDIFIPAAEDSGLVHLITERVCALVAHDAPRILGRAPDLCLSVNLAATDLHRGETVAMLLRLSQSVPKRSGWLTAEVTERGLVRPDEALGIVNALRTAGVRIAIDDFGTGYSSLAYLQHFRFDCLKIDRAFVHTLGTEAPTSHVVFHIIEMARSLGLKMIAEGVETEAQAASLRTLGVEAAQGWLFGRPMNAAALIALIDQEDERIDACTPALPADA